MRPSDAFAGRTAVKVRISLAPYELPGILIDRVVCRNVSEVAHCEKRRNIGVVHEELAAEAVDFECIYLSIFRMLAYGMFLQRLLNL